METSQTQTCTKCRVEKPTSEFYWKKSRGKFHYHCKKCHYAITRAWQKAHPEVVQRIQEKSRMKAAYGITPLDYGRMAVGQGGCCAICEKHQADNRQGRLAIDHCHKTGKIRGLLCAECNLAIGKFRDDPVLMRKAADYVEGN